eukprot:Sspe_Gene.19531::Locus_7130_Transcript_1_1_Confidence_1.000_Length_2358::g.19531::m.19531
MAEGQCSQGGTCRDLFSDSLSLPSLDGVKAPGDPGWNPYADFHGVDIYRNLDWQKVVQGTVASKAVTRLLDEEGLTKGKEARKRMLAKAYHFASGLGSGLNERIVRTARMGFDFIAGQAYNKLDVDVEQVVRLRALAARAAREGKSLIFLPSHKSHVDYMALQYFYIRIGISPPIIAAGDNLNLPVVGRLLQRCGAFFIRRSFRGEDGPLYSAVVSGFLETLLRMGVNIEFFPEGGRSRSGKLLQPKIGMLGMIVSPILDSFVKDAYIVPISVFYDKVMETQSYVTELLGADKKKESVWGILGQGRKLFSMPKLGAIQIRLAPGFSVREYVDTQEEVQVGTNARPEWSLANARHRQVLLRALAYRVLDDINAVSSVPPSALVGTVLLTTRGRGVGREELVRKVAWLRQEIIRMGGTVGAPGMPISQLVDESVKVLSDLISAHKLLEPVYRVSSHFELSYYRNMCVHIFIEQSVVAATMHSIMRCDPERKSVSEVELMDGVQFLSKLLKAEFVFTGATGRSKGAPPVPIPIGVLGSSASISKNFEIALQDMLESNVMQLEMPGADPPNRVIRLFTTDTERWSEHFTFLCTLVWPYIESYWVTLAGLVFLFVSNGRCTHRIVSENVFVKQLQSFAVTLYHLGHLNYYESVSRDSLRHAIATYHFMGVVRRREVTGEKQVFLEIGEEYLKDPSSMVAFEKRVESYRRTGLYKAGVSFPSHLPAIAFGLSARL